MVLAVAVLASFRALGLDVPFGLPFLTDRSQGMATGKRRADDELNSAPRAHRGSSLSAELQMLQHLAGSGCVRRHGHSTAAWELLALGGKSMEAIFSTQPYFCPVPNGWGQRAPPRQFG